MTTGPAIPPSSIVEQIGLTLIPLVVGLLIGGILGLATGYGLRSLYSASPTMRIVAVVLPWRTVLAFLLTCSSTIALFIFVIPLGGLEAAPLVGAVFTVVLLVWTLAVSVLVEHWHPTPLIVRLLSVARTLAVLTVVIAIVVGQFGNVGLGAALYRNVMMMLETSALVPILLAIAAFAFVLDVVFGVFHLIAALASQKPEQNSAAS